MNSLPKVTRNRRSPQGMQSERPVAVRFSPDEKAELIDLARQEDRTQSSFVRRIYLIGLTEYKQSIMN